MTFGFCEMKNEAYTNGYTLFTHLQEEEKKKTVFGINIMRKREEKWESVNFEQ